jgi:hypothetical protein
MICPLGILSCHRSLELGVEQQVLITEDLQQRIMRLASFVDVRLGEREDIVLGRDPFEE